MKQLIKEPLLHFILLGVGLFYFYAGVVQPTSANNEISISESKIEQLIYSFEKSALRPPSEKELNTLIKNHFKEQVAYQKGVEMGLLEGDTLIKKRIQQKLEFIVEDAVSDSEPSDEQLTQFLQAHQEDYRHDERFSFVQLYFDPQKHTDFNGDMLTIFEQLTDQHFDKQEQLLAWSDDIFLELEFTNIPFHQVARLFGSEFAMSLSLLPTNQWQQKIKSGYGTHIVYLKAITGGELQPLEQIHAKVKQDWLNEQREQTLAAFYQNLFDEYQIDTTLKNNMPNVDKKGN